MEVAEGAPLHTGRQMLLMLAVGAVPVFLILRWLLFAEIYDFFIVRMTSKWYAAVLDRCLARLEAALGRVPTDGMPVEQLEAWIDAVVCTLSEDLPAGRLMMRALVDEEPFPAIRLDATDGLDRELMPFELRLAGILQRFRALLEEGMAGGVFRTVSMGDTLLTVIGAITFHFSSGDLGEALLGESIFSASAVERRRREVSEFIRRGLVA